MCSHGNSNKLVLFYAVGDRNTLPAMHVYFALRIHWLRIRQSSIAKESACSLLGHPRKPGLGFPLIKLILILCTYGVSVLEGNFAHKT